MVVLSLAAVAAAVVARAGETRGPLEEIRATGLCGVCVQVGCGDGTRTAELAQSGNLLVHALEADEALVAKARAALAARGLYGQAVIEHWTSPSLPYANELVNVLVAEKPGRIGEKEFLRVLAPNGTAWVLAPNGEWKVLRKPWPKEYDEWTHRRQIGRAHV
jgi:protein-L-isoaspartate O-methyltransferase